jgi:CRISPR-associated protein Csd2
MSHLDPEKRHDFVYLFDVTDGNPNGDPDAGNLPRTDPETMQGLVTDISVKRKIRNYIDHASDEAKHKIYVRQGDVLQNKQKQAYKALDLESEDADVADVRKARDWMCQEFFDVRSFGAVMSHTELNCGQVLGPMQLTFARSIDPIAPMDMTITRSVPISEESREEKGESMFGRKAIVPYGLYRGHGFYNPTLADQTGFDGDDLELFWNALKMCWELDRSASRGMMGLRGLFVFSHDNKLGNAPAHTLFDRIEAESEKDAPRSFSDYAVTVDDANLPDGVTLSVLI